MQPEVATGAALLLGHLVGDFLLQSDQMVLNKRKLWVLSLHCLIVTAISWIVTGFYWSPFIWSSIFISHFLIDLLKIKSKSSSLSAFVLDQSAHIFVLILLTIEFPNTFSSGVWPIVFADVPSNERITELMIYMCGLIATVWAGGYAVEATLHNIDGFTLQPHQRMPGGQIVGRLERFMIFAFVLSGQATAIALLMAAKALRFKQGEPSDYVPLDESRQIGAYVTVGTMASFAWAIGAAYATKAAVRALAP